MLPGDERQFDAVGFLRDEKVTSGTLGGCFQLSQNLVSRLEAGTNHKEVKLVGLVMGVAGLEPDEVSAVGIHVAHPSDVLEGNFEETCASCGRENHHLVPGVQLQYGFCLVGSWLLR